MSLEKTSYLSYPILILMSQNQFGFLLDEFLLTPVSSFSSFTFSELLAFLFLLISVTLNLIFPRSYCAVMGELSITFKTKGYELVQFHVRFCNMILVQIKRLTTLSFLRSA